MRRFVLTTAALLMCGHAALAADKVRGVTDTEILLGTVTDLSGVAAILGTTNVNGWRMAIDEQNAKGGIYGRKIRLIVEDHQYQVPKAVQATNKLLNSDQVFATVGNGGTPMVAAMLEMLKAKGTPAVFPLTASRLIYEPFNPLFFAQFPSFYDQGRTMVNYSVQQGKQAICTLYNDNDLGHEVLQGINDQLAVAGRKLAASAADQPTDMDFSATVAKLYDAKCDVVLLATGIRDTNQIIPTIRQLGWKVDIIGVSSSSDVGVSNVPGHVNDGYYAVNPFIVAYADDPRPEVRDFIAAYRKRFGQDPSSAAEVGYASGQMLILGLQNAGRDLTVDSFIKGIEQIKNYQDVFGSPPMSFSAGNHHGTTTMYLTQVQDGKWVKVGTAPIGY
jgi:branched-chain amino acid transport system substrate-binding protein